MLHSPWRTLFRPSSQLLSARRVGAAALFLTLLGPASLLARHSAHAQDTDPLAKRMQGKVDAPMAVEWKFTGNAFPNNAAAPVVSNDTAFFASGGVVYAVDLASGAQKWRYPTTGALARTILYTPAYSDGTLFVSTGEGMSALDAATGKLRYSPFVVPNGASTSPVVVGDSVYFGSGGGRIFALNAKSGEPVNATFKNGLNLAVDISGNMTTQNGVLYLITANQVMHAIDSLTGNQRWQVRVEGETRGATPIPSGENLFVAAGSALNAYRLSNGVLRWQQPTPRSITAAPAVDSDGRAYIVTSDRAVYVIEGKGNRPTSVWTQNMPKVVPQVDANVITSPIVSEDLVIVTTQGGGIWAFDRATGALKWNYLIHPSGTENTTPPTNVGINANPIVVGDTLYTLSDDGTLTAFRHDASDVSAPVITPITPAQGDYVNGQPPFSIRARLTDEGSGINIDTLSMKVDDNQIPMQKVLGIGTNGFLFNNVTGQLQYTIIPLSGAGRSTALADGHHTITLTVKDWMGNAATKTWGFTVDDTIQRGGKTTTGTTPGRPPFGPGGNSGGGGSGKAD